MWDLGSSQLADFAHATIGRPSVMPRLRVVLPAVVVALALGLVPGVARADGDPASDVLPTEPAFVPYDVGVSEKQYAQLVSLLKEAEHRGYPLRMALIGSAADLGSVTELWREPQSYAEFLGEELSLVYHGTLLVVMPNGFGIYDGSGVPATARSALAGVPVPRVTSATTSAAVEAIRDLAAASGHALPAVGVGASVGSPTRPDPVAWIIFGVGAALIALAWGASLRARPLRWRGFGRISFERLRAPVE